MNIVFVNNSGVNLVPYYNEILDSLKEKGTLPEELADLFTLCQSAEPNDDGSPRYIINAA